MREKKRLAVSVFFSAMKNKKKTRWRVCLFNAVFDFFVVVEEMTRFLPPLPAALSSAYGGPVGGTDAKLG